METSLQVAGGQLPDAALLAGQLAPSSVAGYRRDVTLFCNFCREQSTDPVAPSSLARYRAHLAQRTRLAPATINRRIAATKTVIKEAAAQGYLPAEIAAQFALIAGVKAQALKGRGRPNARTRISPADMRRLTDAPPADTLAGLRDRAFLAVLASSGARLAEACALRGGDLVPAGVHWQLRIIGKGKAEPRLAPLSDEAHARILAWRERCPVASEYIFTSQAGRGARWTDRPLAPASAWRIVTAYAGICGLEFVKPHDLRRFVGTQLAKTDLRMAQKALGHAKIETTMKHYVLDELEVGITEGLY